MAIPFNWDTQTFEGEAFDQLLARYIADNAAELEATAKRARAAAEDVRTLARVNPMLMKKPMTI